VLRHRKWKRKRVLHSRREWRVLNASANARRMQRDLKKPAPTALHNKTQEIPQR
jgi:hypothetical protein